MNGAKAATYTAENAAYHWGVSEPDQWELYDTLKDPVCQNNIAADHGELVESLGTSYDQWWDKMYPVMVEKGGDRSTAKPAH